jgi:hypothetical protein
MSYTEKVEIMFWNGDVIYKDTEEDAQRVIQNRIKCVLKTMKRNGTMWWTEDKQDVIVLDEKGNNLGLDCSITPMLIEQQEWNKLRNKKAMTANELTNSIFNSEGFNSK